MQPDPLPMLTYAEAEAIAADHIRVWPGMMGQSDAPKAEAVADMVQRTIRRYREAIAAREEGL